MSERLDLLNPDGHSFLVWVRFSDEDDDDLRLERCADATIVPQFSGFRIHAFECEEDAVGVHDALAEHPYRWGSEWRGLKAAMEWGVAPMQPFLLSGRIDYEASPDYWSGGVEYDARIAVAVAKRAAWTPEQTAAAWEAFLIDRRLLAAMSTTAPAAPADERSDG